MATSSNVLAASPTVVAATALEARAIRQACPEARILRAGIGLAHAGGAVLGDIVIGCGLAGALDARLRPGTVLVPHTVLRPTGETLTCDPALVQALEGAAWKLGCPSEAGPLVTCTSLVTGDGRRAWRQRGYIGVDMETGLIHARRVATVRVVLDTPGHELAAAWLQPMTVLMHPSAWSQLPWLWRTAPHCARLAAAVLAAALRDAA